MTKNSVKTQPKTASKASKLLREVKNKAVKSVAGSDLVNAKKSTKSKKKK
jgi:hypothetical protein